MSIIQVYSICLPCSSGLENETDIRVCYSSVRVAFRELIVCDVLLQSKIFYSLFLLILFDTWGLEWRSG